MPLLNVFKLSRSDAWIPWTVALQGWKCEYICGIRCYALIQYICAEILVSADGHYFGFVKEKNPTIGTTK